MSTTVRIQNSDKAVLDALQARITLARGKRPSLEEVLHRILGLAKRHEAELVREDEGPDLSEQDIQFYLGLASDHGVETSEEDIDRILYGSEDGPA